MVMMEAVLEVSVGSPGGLMIFGTILSDHEGVCGARRWRYEGWEFGACLCGAVQ